VDVGADLARQVPGRVSTEINARLVYDTQGIVRKVYSISLRILYYVSSYACFEARMTVTGGKNYGRPLNFL